MFGFYIVLFCLVERVRVFASLGGDDQSKCKWVFGKNLVKIKITLSSSTKDYFGLSKHIGMEAAACLHFITKFHAYLWNVSRGETASTKRGSSSGARM